MRRRWFALTAALAAYVGLPYLLVQVGNLGLVRTGRGAAPQVAITFDDGPDPETTPLVLDALREADVRATFFLLGERVLTHPDLARRVVTEGHEVAVHGHEHVHAWRRAPWVIRRDLARARATVRDATGVDVTYFRPPHGAYTLATILALRGSGVTGAHWTLEAHDWHPEFDAEAVTRRVLDHVQPSGVIVMHDAGPGGRTAATALPGLLAELKARGYAPVPLRDLEQLRPERPRDLLPRVLRLVDAAFDRHNGITRIGNRATSLLRGGFSAYPLDGHPNVEKGETLVEIHIDSERLIRVAQSPLRGMRLVRDSMRELAQAMQDRPEWRDVKGVYSIGPFADVLAGLGWEILELPEDMRRRLSLWSSFLRWAYGTASGPAREARLGYISREELIRRHGGGRR